MRSVMQDLKYAVRMLRKTPGFTAVAVMTLALGIGANTAVFTVVNSILLRPLPYSDSERLTNLSSILPYFPEFRLGDSPANYFDIRSGNHSFDSMAMFRQWDMNLSGDGTPESVNALRVTPDFLPLIGASLARGRSFSDDEMNPGSDGVVILTDSIWRTRYGADPHVIGRTIRLDAKPYTVIGIMPASFRFFDAKLLVPLAMSAKDRVDRNMNGYQVMARLKHGVTLPQAQAEMDSFAANFGKQYPNDDEGIKFALSSLQEDTVGHSRLGLMVLMGAVALVLLIGCSNVGSLALAKSLARQKEVAVRSALGASRGRLVRQFLVESLVLALLGGVVGWILGVYGVDAFRHLAPADTPRLDDLRMDRWVFVFSLAVSVLAAILFGLAPALQSSRATIGTALKEAGPFGLTGTRARQRLRSALVVLEVSLSLVLLAGSALLIRSLTRLTHVDPGFRTDHLLTATLVLPGSKYSTPESKTAFLNDFMERLKTLPAESIASANGRVLGGMMMLATMVPEGANSNPNKPPSEETQYVSSNYFSTLQIPLVRGRNFAATDTAKSQQVAIVNESFARRYWPASEALGKRINFNTDPKTEPRWHEVVGVVKDVRDVNPGNPTRPEVYLAQVQTSATDTSDNGFEIAVFLRAKSDTRALLPGLQGIVRSLDPDLPLTQVGTMEDAIHRWAVTPRFRSVLLSVFAGLGLVLSLIGIYGVIAITITQQTREIGIRMALGAQPGDVMRMMLRRGMIWVAAGTAAGLLGALAATRLLGTLLFEVKSTDPVSFAIATGLLVAAALLACYLPARRAMRVDPMVALRYE